LTGACAPWLARALAASSENGAFVSRDVAGFRGSATAKGFSVDEAATAAEAVALAAAAAAAVEAAADEELLALLAAEPGKVFSRDDILNRLRGHEAELYTRAVDIVVSRLRKKLEPLDCIKTLRNAGYALAVAPGEPSS